MPDSCLAEDPGGSNAAVSTALNGAAAVVGFLILVLFRGPESSSPAPESLAHSRTAAFAAVLLGIFTNALAYAAGGGPDQSELGCVIALTNSVGPVPAALLAAIGAVVLLVSSVMATPGGVAAIFRPSLWHVNPRAAAATLFPPGAGWRARDAAVSATAAVTAVFSVCVLAFFDPSLRVPEDASWDVTIGALLVSSVCFGPLLVFLSAVELTSFVNESSKSDDNSAVAAAARLTQGGAAKKSPVGGGQPGSSIEDGEEGVTRLLLVPSESSGVGGGGGGLVPPSAVYWQWLTRSLPSLVANLAVFQMFLWLPVYGAEVASEHLGLDYSDASLVSWAGVGVLAAVLVGCHRAWARRRRARGLQETGAGG
jgi:hypothetical protein